MKTLLAFVALLVSLPAHGATMSAEFETMGFGALKMTLFDTPCDRGLILAQMTKEWQKKFQRAEARLTDGTVLKLCWSGEARPGYAFVVDETGETGTLPLELFMPPHRNQGF